jgi:hypothetical protein
MSLSLASLIGLATFDPQGQKHGWPIFNLLFSIALLFFLLISPAVLYRILLRNRENLRENSFLEKYSSLYESLDYDRKTDKGKYSLLYVPVLFAKRFTMAIAIVAVRNEGGFVWQFVIVAGVSMTTLSYYIKFRPFSTAHIHRMEVINELTLLACLYTCFLFTDYQPGDN